MKRNRKIGTTRLEYREVGARELDRIRGGTVIIGDPGGDGSGPKVTDPGTGGVVIGGDGSGGTGPSSP